MLRFGSTTLNPSYEPPRPPLSPRLRKAALRSGAVGHNTEYVEDWGLATNRTVRFVSSETQGFLMPAQVTAIAALYEAGGAFALETDLLGPLGSVAVVYAARFAPGDPPTFTPATPGGSRYYFDITVII